MVDSSVGSECYCRTRADINGSSVSTASTTFIASEIGAVQIDDRRVVVGVPTDIFVLAISLTVDSQVLEDVVAVGASGQEWRDQGKAGEDLHGC